MKKAIKDLKRGDIIKTDGSIKLMTVKSTHFNNPTMPHVVLEGYPHTNEWYTCTLVDNGDEVEIAESHRDFYPEQYEHPFCGKLVTMDDGTEYIIERVVNSRFGQLFFPKNGDGKTAYALTSIIEVDGRVL